MKLHTPPTAQGQIVQVSYGWLDGTLYRRTYDRCDQTTRWARASHQREVDRYLASGRDPWDEAPRIAHWQACREPHDD